MSVEITLKLSDVTVEKATKFGQATQRDLQSVLADTLEMMWPTLGEVPDTSFLPPVTMLSNADVLTLSKSKMDSVQNQRLGILQSKGKEHGLTADERYELMALLHIYQLGQLRKAEALAESVRRGLLNSPFNSSLS